MTRSTVKLWLFALLHILTFTFADPSPKGGKGGKGDGGSDSSGSDGGGDSGDDGGDSTPKGKQHVEISGNKWPYRWAGSYYNGSMSVEVSIESWPGCSEGSRRGIHTTKDGILLLGPANQTGSFDDVDPNFVLMGWHAGKAPTNNWTDGIYWGNGGPGRTRWYSTDVKLMLSRFVSIWQSSTSESRPYDLGWHVDSEGNGNGNDKFQINGTFSGSSTTFDPQDNSQDNWMQITTFLCNNETTVDTFTMQPWTYSSAVEDWPTKQNTTFSGTFSDKEASITWSGNFWAGFNSIDYGVPSSKSGYPQGYFRVAFNGKIDASESDELVARAEDPEYYESDGGPTWNMKLDRSQNEPDKYIYYTNGAMITTLPRVLAVLAGFIVFTILIP